MTTKQLSYENTAFLGEESDTSEPFESDMSFEDLRKHSRQIETEIDHKLVLLSKLASNFGNGTKSKPTDPDSAPLLSSDDKFDIVANELEELLANLSDINERMGNCPTGNSSTMVHTLQRHRDILQDYTREFNRTKATVNSRKERELLLSGSGSGKLISGLSRRDLYLKENQHLSNSERMIDDQISIAMETRDHMKTQRETFKMIQTKVNDLSNRFPMINSLITRINLKKRKDAIILGCLIGLCVTFLLWWAMG